jgi:hypothetical protein
MDSSRIGPQGQEKSCETTVSKEPGGLDGLPKPEDGMLAENVQNATEGASEQQILSFLYHTYSQP